MVPEEIEIEKIDEAEFRNRNTHFELKTGHSTRPDLIEGLSAASSSKDVDGATQNISSADLSVSSSPRDCCTDSNILVDYSSPLAKRGDNYIPFDH